MITGKTGLYAVLGRPVAHSASPELHNAWFARHGIDAVYVALEVEAGAEGNVLGALSTLGLRGANLTAPLKQVVSAQVARCSSDAEAAGAINTLSREGARWVGDNTDVEGFCRAVEDTGERLAGRDARIIGAGGAARAVAVGLGRRCADRIVICARRPAQAESLVRSLAGRLPKVRFETAPIENTSLCGADLCVVATSGRPEVLGRLDPAVLRKSALWVDLNYWDPDPPGASRARAAGLRVLDGLGMLRWQARLAFQRWTGVLPE